MQKVIVIGSGCAGYTAAIYLSRANLSPLVIEGFLAGGQLTLTSLVENYPGFPDGIMGNELMESMRKQAEKFGTTFITKNATKIDFTSKPFKVWVDEDIYEAASVIIATGATSKLLGLESEKRLFGKGVSTCAVCDGFFYRGKRVAVVGGGDSALEEGIFLTKFAEKVSIIHRRDALRGSKILQKRAFENEKIEFIWDSVVEDIEGDEAKGVTAVKIKNLKTSALTLLPCDGLFVAIGHTPATELFKEQIELDEKGYIITGKFMETSVAGIFACGDVQDIVFKQAVTAAGTGCMAALQAEKYIEAIGYRL